MIKLMDLLTEGVQDKGIFKGPRGALRRFLDRDEKDPHEPFRRDAAGTTKFHRERDAEEGVSSSEGRDADELIAEMRSDDPDWRYKERYSPIL